VSLEVPLKRKSGEVCVGAKENAERFGEHFEELYLRAEGFDASAIDCIPKHEVDEEGGRVAGEKEVVMQAVQRLNVSSPGCSGVSAAAVKAAMEDVGMRAVMVQVVGEFWETEVVPAGWEDGLLKILPKSGDLSKPGNYRGIMLLEVLYKVVANIIKSRLTPIQESLEQETQCGFRPGRGCTDASFSLRMAIKKRREHGLETWVLLLDLVKAFGRVPRTLLWRVLRRFGVHDKIVRLLEALHSTVNVRFSVEEVEMVIESIIGVKQGDLLGPQLFIFHICAIMQAWRYEFNSQYDLCRFRTTAAGVVSSQRWDKGMRGLGAAVSATGVLEVRETGVVLAAAYIQVRVRALQGLTVADALQSTFTTAAGGVRWYGRADLKWDLQHGYI